MRGLSQLNGLGQPCRVARQRCVHIMAAMAGHDAPTEAEIAAALAAIQLIVQAPGAGPDTTRAGWQDSAKLSIQHLRPVRIRLRPSWSTIERLRRGASGGFSGVAGL